ncbi:MAG: FAD-binding dehydrogenase [Alphaproteobacteria bacterium]|nr:FAD-binding dehydrogenase [Alphaproteobacteria bacterium]
MTKYQSDVVIIGGGIAGIVTALECLDGGKSVTIIDRDVAENFGGLAKESFGGMFFVDTPLQRKARIVDSPERAFSDWCSFGELSPADGLAYQWAERYVARTTAEVHDFVTPMGINFLPVLNWVERGWREGRMGNSVPRFHMVWGTGHELATVLAARLRNHGGAGRLRLIFGQRVEELITTDGRITGCRGVDEAEGTAFEAEAEAVVIAAGGSNGNDGFIRDHWHRDWGASPPETILNGSHKFADATLHHAAAAVGGSLVNLDQSWNYAAGIPHPRPRKPRHGLSLVPCKTALWMDAAGRRIGPEPLIAGFDTRELIKRICQNAEAKQLPKYSWQVMNRKIMLKEFAISGAESNPAIRDKSKLRLLGQLLFGSKELVDATIADSADIVTAPTVGELAAKMNALDPDVEIDGAGMAADIEAYDRDMAKGTGNFTDEQIKRIALLRQWRADKVRTCKFQKIDEAKAGPLVAIRSFIISRKSLGGIETDLDCRVVDGTGAALDGLYAVGEAAGFGGGGMHGLRALEGTFLGGCVFSARMAARAIVSGTSADPLTPMAGGRS